MSLMKKLFSTKKIIIAIIIIAVVFGIFKFTTKSNSESKFNPKTQTTITPQKETITEEITLTGSINATLKANLHFQASGQLAWVGVKAGDTVKKYQSIASLNKEALKKQLEIEFNNYKTAATNFYDTSDEYKDSILTDEVRRILQRSQNTLNNSVASYELNDLSIKYSTLTTPIAGVVVSVDQPNAGTNVLVTDNIATVIDPQSIYFSSKIDQEDVPKIKVGNKATIKLDSFSDTVFDSQISYIAFTPVSGESSTVYEVRFSLPKDSNGDLKYRIGMDGDVSIPVKQNENALTLPIDSIYQDQEQTYVLVKGSNNDLTKKIIKTGIENDTTVEILEGLSENDQVVITK